MGESEEQLEQLSERGLHALFETGRACLCQGKPYEALTAYTRALQWCSTAPPGIPEQLFKSELDVLSQLQLDIPGSGCEWAWQVLLLGQAVHSSGTTALQALKGLAQRQASFAEPVIIVCGGASAQVEHQMQEYLAPLLAAFSAFYGTVISGGTTSGISGVVGAVAEASKQSGNRLTEVIGYLPGQLPSTACADSRYHELVSTERVDFSPAESLQYWIDLLCAGVRPSAVRLLGIDGGPISGFEYRLALALGATVGVVKASGRAVDELREDLDWKGLSNLLFLPMDIAVIRNFIRRT